PMIAIVAIAIAAGAASALMFASVISGALISLVLFYLAPLPLMVAVIGWGPMVGAIGGLAAAAGLCLLFSFGFVLSLSLSVALPAWWLGHLTLLGRPAANAAPPAAGAAPVLEWYPTGRLLLWIAAIGVVMASAALLSKGDDAAAIAAAVKR